MREREIIEALVNGLRTRFVGYSDTKIRWSYTDSKIDIYVDDSEVPTYTIAL
jgi:hypothetical protein